MSEITYSRIGDYQYPNLTLGEQPEGRIGKYGMLRRTFLKHHRKGTFNGLILDGTLTAHLMEIDRTARERVERIVEQMAKQCPPPDKATDQMGWVGHMNNLKQAAEEIVLAELVYN